MAEEANTYTRVWCAAGHKMFCFECKNGPNAGKLYWKSNECKTFKGNNYIEALAPYDEPNKVLNECSGVKMPMDAGKFAMRDWESSCHKWLA